MYLLQDSFPGAVFLRRSHVLTGGRPAAQYFNLGARVGGQGGMCSATLEQQDLVRYVNAFLAHLFPEGTWTSICVSHNEFAHIHQDFNSPDSQNYTLSLGAFSGGGLWLEGDASAFPGYTLVPPPDKEADQSLRGAIVCTRRAGFSFNGRLRHCSEPWVGDRWVVIAYTAPNPDALSADDVSLLAALGFPLPRVSSTPPPPSARGSVVATPAPDAQVTCPSPTLPEQVLPPHFPALRRNLFLELCSGRNRPLSSAALRAGVSVISVDILRSCEQDILQDSTYDALLRLGFSGQVTLANASPPCTEYSRLKLLDNAGPRPLRSPDHMEGFPDLNAEEKHRFEQSRLLLFRSLHILRAVWCGGGHISFEHPANSLAWLEKETQAFLKHVSADLNCIAACRFGADWYKRWLFACTWRDMQGLACACNHAPDSHQQVVGARNSDGTWASAATSEFPPALAEAYVAAALPLFETCADPVDLSLAQLPFLVPKKGMHSPPFGTQDGGGIFSCPDWSKPPSDAVDVFDGLRQELVHYLLSRKAPLRLQEHVQSQCEDALFSADEVLALRAMWSSWFTRKGWPAPDWTVPPSQPYCLHALSALSRAMGDRDDMLFPCLLEGIPTGFFNDIPRSNVFIPVEDVGSLASDDQLQICESNWQGARENPAILHELVQKEVDEGWLEEVPLSEAKQRWDKIAVAKLNVVLAENKKPRLIMDGTISGTNPSCFMNEKYNLPGLQDVRSCFPLRGCHSQHAGFSLDIRAAHKTIRIKESERGLCGIKLEDGRHYWYRVCPFGTNFSALWWARLSSFMIRVFHLLLWVAHMLSIYVDDLLLVQDDAVVAVFGSLLLSFCQSFGIPLSWAKVQLSHELKWLGWCFNFRAGTFWVPEDKRAKLLHQVRVLLRKGPVEKQALEQTVGLLMWITQASVQLRPWLCNLWRDLQRPAATNFSISSSEWQTLKDHLDENLRFCSTPPGTAIPCGATLISARHVPLRSKADLCKVPLTTRRVYMRIADPQHRKRHVSEASRRFLLFWEDWCLQSPSLTCLQPSCRAISATLAADAFASSLCIGIGGFLRVQGSSAVWFSERFALSDMQCLGVPLAPDAQKNIGCWELLAQMALLILFAEVCPGGRAGLSLRTFCDNSAAESAGNRMLTTSSPLCFFAQQLACLSFKLGLTLDIQHISGFRNTEADFLSRWQPPEELQHGFELLYRYRFPVARIWQSHHDVRLFPADTKLLWQPP